MLQEKLKNLNLENQIWRELTQNNMKQEPPNVSKENHNHSEVATENLNFGKGDIGGKMMNDECGDSHEENHKRVKFVVDFGGSEVIGKMARENNKSSNVKDKWVKVKKRSVIMKIKSVEAIGKSVKAMKKLTTKKMKNPNLIQRNKFSVG